MNEPTEVCLVDVSHLFHQSYAVSGAEDADAACRRTVARVRGLARTYPHLAVCADHPSKNFRHKLSEVYKANREAKPEEFRAQMRNTIAQLTRDGFPIWSVEGFEADDVICSATWIARERSIEVIIASADKDLLQLVGEGVKMLSTREDGKIWTPEDVVAKFGVGPDALGDWLAIVGDKSDNVAGIRGIGEKGATKLLARFKTLEGVLAAPGAQDRLLAWQLRASNGEAASELGPKPELPDPPLTEALAKALVDHADAARLSRKLVELRSDVPIDFEQVCRPRVEVKQGTPVEFDGSEEDQMSDETESVGQQAQPEAMAIETPTPNAEPSPKPAEQSKEAEIEFSDAKPTAITLAQPVEWQHALEPRTSRDAWMMSRVLHESRLFSHFNNREGIFSAILLARSHGIEMMKVLLPGMVHSINGKLSMSAIMIVGLVQRSGKCEYFEMVESTETKAVYETKRVGGRREIRLDYTIEEARKAGLKWAQPNAIGNIRPRTMLRHRCETELARAVYQDVVGGLYSLDELTDGDRV